MNDLQREKFEEWAVSHGMSVRRTPKHPEDYFFRTTHSCWVGWRAAIESVVVELPPEHEVAHRHDAREMVYAIKNSGIKTK
jgi:hypothetical protein